MKTTRHYTYILALLLTAASANAKKDSDLKSVLAKPGKLLTEETFSTPSLNKPWRALIGDWQIKEGSLVGISIPSQNHPPAVSCAVPNHNSILRFSFKLNDKKGFGLSYNSAKGHLFRVLLSKDGISINKDGSKTDKAIKGENLATKKVEIKVDEWHTIQVEVLGTKVYVQTDDRINLEASNPELDVDKSGYNFVGGGAMIDDVKAWQAL